MDTTSISIRTAECDDYVALWSIAALDSATTVPAEPLLLAEEDGAIVAALSLASGHAIADPFRRTAGALALLSLRASQHDRERASRRGLLARLRERTAPVPAAQ
jgi:phage portal protein BeeE